MRTKISQVFRDTVAKMVYKLAVELQRPQQTGVQQMVVPGYSGTFAIGPNTSAINGVPRSRFTMPGQQPAKPPVKQPIQQPSKPPVRPTTQQRPQQPGVQQMVVPGYSGTFAIGPNTSAINGVPRSRFTMPGQQPARVTPLGSNTVAATPPTEPRQVARPPRQPASVNAFSEPRLPEVRPSIGRSPVNRDTDYDRRSPTIGNMVARPATRATPGFTPAGPPQPVRLGSTPSAAGVPDRSTQPFSRSRSIAPISSPELPSSAFPSSSFGSAAIPTRQPLRTPDPEQTIPGQYARPATRRTPGFTPAGASPSTAPYPATISQPQQQIGPSTLTSVGYTSPTTSVPRQLSATHSLPKTPSNRVRTYRQPMALDATPVAANLGQAQRQKKAPPHMTPAGMLPSYTANRPGYRGYVSANAVAPKGYEVEIAKARAYREANPQLKFETDISDEAFSRRVPIYDLSEDSRFWGQYNPVADEIVAKRSLPDNAWKSTLRHEYAHARQPVTKTHERREIPGVLIGSPFSPQAIEQEASMVELKQWLHETNPGQLKNIKTKEDLLDAIRRYPNPNWYQKDLLQSKPEAQEEIFKLWPGMAQNNSKRRDMGLVNSRNQPSNVYS